MNKAIGKNVIILYFEVFIEFVGKGDSDSLSALKKLIEKFRLKGYLTGFYFSKYIASA